MKLHFATLFDKNYLDRGLVLYDSLNKHCKDFALYILALDEFTFNYFEANGQYEKVILIRLDEVEEYDPELKNIKPGRSIIEYYFTLSPSLPLYILNKFQPDHICTLDADILFFNNPVVLFECLTEYEIVI